MSTASSNLKARTQRVTSSVRHRTYRQMVIDLDRMSSTEHSPPWAMDLLDGFLAQHNAEVRLACLDRIGPLKPIAWIAYSWDARWNLEIHRIAVRPGYRRQGVGRWLIDCAAESSNLGVSSEVRERDLGSQLFLKSCGFLCTHIMERLEEDGGDCYLFVRSAS